MSRTFAESSEFKETDKALKHELGLISTPVPHMCCAGAVVAFWFVTHEVVVSNTAFCRNIF